MADDAYIDKEYELLSDDMDRVAREIRQIRNQNAELRRELEEVTHRSNNLLTATPMPKDDKGTLSSQTDLSKISSTGLKAYHSISSKNRSKPKQKSKPLIQSDVTAEHQLVFVGAEVAPWSKTGGLGDVMGSLPFALAKLGHRVMVVTPRYLNGQSDRLYDCCIDSGCRVILDMGHGGQQQVKFHTYRKDNVDFVFVDHPCYHRPGAVYGDEWGVFKDNTFRYALLSMAACEAPLNLPLATTTSWQQARYGENVVFLANDWHAALVPVYLQAKYHPHGVFQTASCILAIHNLAHQGIESPAMFHNLGIPESHYGVLEWVANDGFISMNTLKGGLVTADRIVTVSCMHAFDMLTPQGAMGLHPVLQCRQNVMNGIVNGIDHQEWNPETDPYIAKTYSANDLSGKVNCKLSLQRELRFRTSSKTPLIGYIGRLDHQKGPDLVLQALPWMMSHRCQVVMLGTGDPNIETEMKLSEEKYKGSFCARVGFSVPLSHRIIAGCDFILMPSRFEPCGLTQQFAIRYGTVPIAHATGGLMDTIEDFCPFGETMGTGFLFRKPDVEHLIRAIDRALDTYESNENGLQILQHGMRQDFTWTRSAIAYESVIQTCVRNRMQSIF